MAPYGGQDNTFLSEAGAIVVDLIVPQIFAEIERVGAADPHKVGLVSAWEEEDLRWYKQKIQLLKSRKQCVKSAAGSLLLA